jgi:hypothetical protein
VGAQTGTKDGGPYLGEAYLGVADVRATISSGWWVQPGQKVLFVSSNKTVGGIRTCHLRKLRLGKEHRYAMKSISLLHKLDDTPHVAAEIEI